MGRIVLLCLVLAAGVCGQQNKLDDANVASFFPQSLLDKAAVIQRQPARRFGYVDANLSGVASTGHVVAAYSNGISAAILVLQRAGNSMALVASPDIPFLQGDFPTVEALDVDNDGRQEAIVSFEIGAQASRGELVLKWNGTTLQSIGPTIQSDGFPHSLLANSSFVDLDGDGKMEALTNSQLTYVQLNDPNFVTVDPIYRLSGSVYSSTPWAVAAFHEPFVRRTGQPVTKSVEFRAATPAPSWRLLVVNGIFGSPRVASGTIRLNGVEVVSQNQLSQQVGYLTVAVTVQQSNTIEVTLGGTPLGSILVLVLPPE